MDVQTENTDPPPCESQSAGKIRKGFKLFGKRKPGNIFSIRSKGDGNNKSPVKTGKSLEGLSETTAPDSEQDSDKEKGHEVSQGEREQADEEPLGEDGVLAAAPTRTSISSISSARSLSFLSMLRGGRRGVGDRQAHTVSQPTGRQRRGLKGLFGNVKFKSKDKEDKEETPPSPLLMSSRANSVEIIKEDLTLTPKSQPRSLDSPETESYEPFKSVATQDSAASSSSETSGNVSKTNEHVPPLPASEPPMIPGDNSLSSLLADISSLLTFDSISGGDIMADVEAEWGKASSAISAVVTEVTPSSTSLFSKPTISSPLTSTSVGPAANLKPSPVAVPSTSSTQSFTPLTKTTSVASPIAKPSTIITTLTKSSTLTTQSVKLSSDSSPASHLSTSTAPVTLTSFSAPKMCSLSMTTKSTLSTTPTSTAAPPYIPPTVVKPPSVSLPLTSTVSKLASEIAPPPQTSSSVSKPSPVAAPTTAKPPVTHSPPTPVSFTQHPPPKLDSSSSANLKTSSLSSAAGESKAPATDSLTCTVTTKPSSPAPVISSKMTTVPTSTATSSSVPAALSKPTPMSSPLDFKRTPPSLVTVPDLSSNLTSTAKTQPSPASVPTPSSTSLDKAPPAYKPPPTPVFLDKTPPAPSPKPAPVTHAGFSIPSQTPAPFQIPVSQSKAPPAPIQPSLPKDPPTPAPMQVSQSKAPPSPAQIPISVSKGPSTPAQMPISVSKDLPAPVPAQVQVCHSKAPPPQVQIPVPISTDTPAPSHNQIPVSVSKDPPAPARIPISVSKDDPAPARIQISVSKDDPAPCQIPVSVSTDPPAPVRSQISVSKDTPAPAQIPVSKSTTPSAPTPAPCPVSSFSSPPSPWQREAPASAKIRGSEQASMDGKQISQSGTDVRGSMTALYKTEEPQNESRASFQGTPREKKTPQVKASGLSKIPVVGGGRVGKLPIRDSQHADDDASRDPPTPVFEEERANFNSYDAGSKDKISDVEVNVPISKHSQEESQQQKVLTSLPRDSKIPVKHGSSQIPQAKETPRTKIPVSKVPVRRVGNKPAASGSYTQIRK